MVSSRVSQRLVNPGVYRLKQFAVDQCVVCIHQRPITEIFNIYTKKQTTNKQTNKQTNRKTCTETCYQTNELEFYAKHYAETVVGSGI